ncbi:MupA/Atu3671 family FMN-dependent luciferase-like monooxygenase [Pantoea agglomerans]|uniref:MupA/Atu3671 family FMN-dependent luciferase-like monooxygenase n=1 Tax=Enterobacter agglomerans TaxID=549 RepID=UPI00289E2DA4|nr:MupA/Atu3671 family FMN-dependent luciferase-like monooxygenase [Pantoea agglomerans]WNK36098.1 LLM class flavin-dependent oxidoreductase [Pantoea agglomerans]
MTNNNPFSSLSDPAGRREHSPGFSVFFFSGEASEQASENIYSLVMRAAKFADDNGFEAIWVPERHFHSFGGLFPSPAIIASAIAATTKRLHIRAGSVVLPMHNPVNVVEEWSVIDNISNGRVGLSVAPGFHPSDFLLKPENYLQRRDIFRQNIQDIMTLWRGDTFIAPDGLGRDTRVLTLPRPLQKALPLWLTASESEESFRRAGAAGANVLTSLLALDRKTLAARISAWRQSFIPGAMNNAGRITLMLHTFVSPDESEVHKYGVEALKRYLKEHLSFAAPRADYDKITCLSDSDKDALVEYATRRYTRDASLIGTPEHCKKIIEELVETGVDEIACLIDFGVPEEQALHSLEEIAKLKEYFSARKLARSA